MRTNNKKVREQIQAHILDCVYDENGNSYTTFKEAKSRLRAEFDRVANYEYNKKRIPNNQDRFSDYMDGLPFHFEYTYFGIKNYLNSLGINESGKEYSDDKSHTLYHYLIYKEIS